MGHIAGADAQGVAPVLAQLVDQRPEVAVARDDDEGTHLLARDGRLERIQRHADVGPILAGAHAVDLHQVNRIVHQVFAIAGEAAPVAVDPFDDHRPPALEIFHQRRQFQIQEFLFGPQRHVFEVDKDGNLVTHKSLPFVLLVHRNCMCSPPQDTQKSAEVERRSCILPRGRAERTSCRTTGRISISAQMFVEFARPRANRCANARPCPAVRTRACELNCVCPQCAMRPTESRTVELQEKIQTLC